MLTSTECLALLQEKEEKIRRDKEEKEQRKLTLAVLSAWRFKMEHASEFKQTFVASGDSARSPVTRATSRNRC